ncbi:MAG TPA: PIN domain-containing protein [Bryobacteraceae bacterium]|nr:PIN domain-containing protein [Bryobacteraceae bacterium]
MKAAVFADAFYWIALTNPADATYHAANEMDRTLSRTMLVTTDEVLTEFLTFFGGDPWLRFKAAKTAQGLLKKINVRVVPQTRNSFLSGLDLYMARLDKGYSLPDCISMKTMEREGLTDVLTNDRHFEQEGFRALFRS